VLLTHAACCYCSWTDKFTHKLSTCPSWWLSYQTYVLSERKLLRDNTCISFLDQCIVLKWQQHNIPAIYVFNGHQLTKDEEITHCSWLNRFSNFINDKSLFNLYCKDLFAMLFYVWLFYSISGLENYVRYLNNMKSTVYFICIFAILYLFVLFLVVWLIGLSFFIIILQ